MPNRLLLFLVPIAVLTAVLSLVTVVQGQPSAQAPAEKLPFVAQPTDILIGGTISPPVQVATRTPSPTNSFLVNLDSAPKVWVQEVYSELPLSFEANRGQTDDEVEFLSRGGGYSLFLTSKEVVLVFSNPSAPTDDQDKTGAQPTPPPAEDTQDSVFRMQLLKAVGTEGFYDPISKPQVTGLDELVGKSNYFIGNNQIKWRTSIPHYARVQYSDVYRGVDLIIHGSRRQLHYEFLVAPGAIPGLSGWASRA